MTREDVVVRRAAAARSAATNGSSRSSRRSSRLGERRQVGELQRPVDAVDVVAARASARRAGSVATLGGGVVRELEAHRAAALAPAQLLLDGLRADPRPLPRRSLRSQLRVTRKALHADRPRKPGKSSPTCSAITPRAARSARRRLAGGTLGTRRGEHRGHLHHRDDRRGCAVALRAPRAASSDREVERLGCAGAGTGGPGSTASGVSTGKTSLREVAPRARPAARRSSSSAREHARSPAAPRARAASSLAPDAVLLGDHARARAALIAASCSAGSHARRRRSRRLARRAAA